MEGDSLMLRGSWFHSLVMKSIGERCFSVTMLNLRCLICEALSLQISMNWLMARGSFLLMNLYARLGSEDVCHFHDVHFLE